MKLGIHPTGDVTSTPLVSSEPARLHHRGLLSSIQVCQKQHNATLSHSKCFSIGICLLSRKMESWGGHIWGPPLWVFTLKDKWSHWLLASCEWAPSAHMGPLNAHQNNFSKPRDAFLRCLMWGQIGNHFNKIPPRLNCISQKTRPERGETQGTATVEPLPADFKAYLKREHSLCWQVYSRRTCNRNAQVTDSRLKERRGWHFSARKDVDQSRRLGARVDLWNLWKNIQREKK